MNALELRGRCPGRLAAPLTRRDMLRGAANGFGLLALSGLLSQESRAVQAADEWRATSHFAPKVKRVVFCFMD